MQLDDVKKEFLNGTTKGAFAKFVDKRFDVANDKLFVAAVSQGYDDAKRTFSGVTKFWDGQPADKQREDFFAFVGGMLQAACKDCPSDFNTWHAETCNKICKWFEDAHYEKNVHFGQAQKLVNMAFKYLYCLGGAEKHPIFQQCHMPLDSFTLEWYKRYVTSQAKYKDKKYKTYKITEKDKWSNLKPDKYANIVSAIAEYLSGNPAFCYKKQEICLSQYPLDAEFYIWPEMQMHLSAESFYFSFSEAEMSREEKCEWKLKSVFDKLTDIQECIDQYQKSTK